MDADRTPEQVAAGMVRVVSDGGAAPAELTAPGTPAVRLRPHQNPDLTEAEADRLRAFLAAVVRAARGEKT